MNDSELIPILLQLEPNQLLSLYMTNKRMLGVIQHIFLHCKELPECALPDDAPRAQRLINGAWRYLSVRTLHSLPNIRMQQSVLVASSSVKANRIRVRSPRGATIFFNRRQYNASRKRQKLLCDRKNKRVIEGTLPGSKSGNSCIYQIMVQKTEVLNMRENCSVYRGCGICINSKGAAFNCSAREGGEMYRVNVPPVDNVQLWVDALCKHFINQGLHRPLLFMCENSPVDFRLLSKSHAQPAMIVIHTIPSGYPCYIVDPKTSKSEQECRSSALDESPRCCALAVSSCSASASCSSEQ